MMAAFKFAGGHCGSGDCGCTAQICVDVLEVCSPYDPVVGATVTLYLPGTLTVAGTGTTDVAGHVCITVASGLYDVVVTASGYTPSTTDGVSTGTTLSISLALTGSGGIVLTVRGCNFLGLPGAVVTFKGPNPSTTTVAVLTTDSAGKVHFVPAVGGTYAHTITHSSGRFTGGSGDVLVNGPCAVARTGIVSMGIGAAYLCCGTKLGGVASPFPMSKTLNITTAGGTDTLSVSVCSGSICLNKVMSDVGPNSTSTLSCPPPPTPNNRTVPPAIGSAAAFVSYGFNLWDVAFSAPTLSETIAEHGSLNYPSGGCSGPVDVSRNWRIPGTGCVGGTTRSATTATVNSLAPTLSITFTIPAGTGFGPPATGTGNPFSTTVVIAE